MVDMGVDGFRFDVINFLMHDRRLRNNPRRPDGAPLPAGGHPDIEFFHFVNTYNIGQPETYDALRTIRGLLDGYEARTSLAEISCAEDALAEAGKAVGDDRLHLSYNSSLVTEEPLSAQHMRCILEQAEELINRGGICWTAGTHDFPRLASRWHEYLLHNENFDQDAFNFMVAVLLISLPGACCLYQGDELGLPEAELLYEDMRDPFGLRHYPDFLGRDGCRTPLPWQSGQPHFGFTQADKPWLPVHSGHEILSINIQEQLPESLLNRYRRLIHWRRDQAALVNSMRIKVLPSERGILAYVRGSEDEQQLLFVLNMTEKRSRVALDTLPEGEPVAAITDPDTRLIAGELEVGAYGFWVARLPQA